MMKKNAKKDRKSWSKKMQKNNYFHEIFYKKSWSIKIVKSWKKFAKKVEILMSKFDDKNVHENIILMYVLLQESLQKVWHAIVTVTRKCYFGITFWVVFIYLFTVCLFFLLFSFVLFRVFDLCRFIFFLSMIAKTGSREHFRTY